jgi:hypothetical protein
MELEQESNYIIKTTVDDTETKLTEEQMKECDKLVGIAEAFSGVVYFTEKTYDSSVVKLMLKFIDFFIANRIEPPEPRPDRLHKMFNNAWLEMLEPYKKDYKSEEFKQFIKMFRFAQVLNCSMVEVLRRFINCLHNTVEYNNYLAVLFDKVELFKPENSRERRLYYETHWNPHLEAVLTNPNAFEDSTP